MKTPSKLIFLSFLAALLCVYSPVYCFEYLFHDDVYFWIKEPWAPLHYQHTMLMNMGRPLAAWLVTIENFFIHNISDLMYLRLMAIVTLSFCTFLCFGHLKRWLKNDLQAWCVALMIFTLPPFQDIIFYAVGWFFSLAILLA